IVGPFAGNKIDRKAPVITVSAPTANATYGIGQLVNAAYGCVDAGSGTNTCSGTVANLSAIDTSSLRQKSFTVTAADAAGNSTSTTVTYSVALPTVATFTVSPASVAGGAVNTTATLTLNAPAFGTPAQRRITFTSDNDAAAVRGQVTLAVGETSASFP